MMPGGPSRRSDHADPSARQVAGRLKKIGRLFAASGAEWTEPARRVTVTDPTVCWFASIDSTHTLDALLAGHECR